MINNRRPKADVLFGDSLLKKPPIINTGRPVCTLPGNIQSTEHFNVTLDSDILSKHLMLLGGIGTGKTNALYHIVSQLSSSLSKDDVMIIFDTKGDFLKEFYCPGDVVISNDSSAVGKSGMVNYWNIFNEIQDDDHQLETIIETAKSLFAEACERTNQIFFPNAAKDIFMACMLHVLRNVPKEYINNKTLVDYINHSTAANFKAMLENYDDLRSLSSYISVVDSPQTQGVVSELLQIVREIFIGNFAKEGTLSLRELVREKGGCRVFIEYDLSIGKMLSPVYSLMFDLAIKEALSRGRSEGNVYFITDEFKLLPNLSHIDDAVNFGRSLGIKFMIGVQNVEQIYDNYGEERARSIMSGFSTNISFRVNDAKSREYIQGLYGKNQKLDCYMPGNQRNGIVESQREAYVVEDWDITNLGIGEAIIGLPGYSPFVFKFDKYK